MAQNNTQTVELPQWLNIFIFIALIVILLVFGDLFTFIVGSIGVIVAFVAYFNGVKHEEHH